MENYSSQHQNQFQSLSDDGDQHSELTSIIDQFSQIGTDLDNQNRRSMDSSERIEIQNQQQHNLQIQKKKKQTTQPQVFVFGQNSYGELGLGDTQERHAPTQVHFFDDHHIIQIAAGNEHIGVLTKQGEVYTVGFNGSGQLGHGNTRSISLPKKIEQMKSIKINQLSSANGCENLALLSQEGKLYTCGYNNYGQLGHGTQTNLSAPTPVQALKDFFVINASCSYYHSLIVVNTHHNLNQQVANTNVYSVGRNDNGQLGQEHQCHEVVPKIIRSLNSKHVVMTSAGLHHSVFVTQQGEVFSCGFNDNGQLGQNDTRSRSIPTLIEAIRHKFIIQSACGYYHTIVLTESGEIYAFGRNDKGQLGIETNLQAVISPRQITEFLTVVTNNNNNNNNFNRNNNFPNFTNQQLSQQEDSNQDNIFNNNKQIQYLPKRVNISKIACGCYHSITLCENGNVYTFGRGNHGQLGHQSTEDQKLPKQVYMNLQDKKVIDIAGGFYHTILLVKHKKNSKKNYQLANDMKKIINDYQRADVTFLFENNTPLHAHRCIILCRCKYLDERIKYQSRKSDERERNKWGIKNNNHVVLEMKNIHQKAFLQFLEYLYTDQIKALKLNIQEDSNNQSQEIEYILDLFQLSIDFKMDNLKGICMQIIEQMISIENCSIILKKVYEIGDISGCNLKQFCMTYILEKYQQVISQPSFYDLPKELMMDINFTASRHGVQVNIKKQKNDNHSL